ncbi:protease complex subunit PrcB family protein [Flavobacterium haoranii]|uniref:PrcB C-terminal n=1 Tax=Flavobacterium haoranii TaxID=683124 RepID=A0A1M6HQZ1_9FLAO|nr:protease complex subunit PrcB family protein [Flavobacterium haoranii]SHJ24553.1 PrcB C-terminal [Flavobacterium haoranii]
MKKILLISFSSLLFSCGSPTKVFENTQFDNIYKAQNSGKSNSGFEVLDSNEEYLAFVEKMKLDQVEDVHLFEPDFENNSVIAVFMGQKSSGGYEIEVESLYWVDSVLHVKTKKINPKKGEMSTMALTSPYCLTIIPKAKTIVLE